MESTVANAGGWEDAYAYKTLASSYSALYMRVYVYFNTLAITTFRRFFGLFTNTAAERFCLGLDATNHLKLRYYDGSVTEDTSATTVTTGQWYCIEIFGDVNAVTGAVTVWLDGVEVADLTHNNIDGGGINLQRVQVGIHSSASSTINMNLDCVVVADAYIGVESEGNHTDAILEETIVVSASLDSEKSLYRSSSETTATTSSLTTTKTLYRSSGSSFTVETITETQKDLNAMFIEQLETVTVTAGLYTTKHIAATLIELTETLTILANLYTDLLVELTTSDLLGLIIVFSVIALAIALCALGLHFKKK